MASLLSSSIVHDVKNIVTNLNLFTQNIRTLKFDKKINKMMVSSLQSSLYRLQKLKNKLLFTEEMKDNGRMIKIDNFIKNYIKENLYIFKDIKLVKDLKSRSEVYIDPEKLKFVIDNIFLNAQESLFLKKEEGIISVVTFKKNKSVVLSIRDNGIGMDLNEIKNLLKPFYSLKKKGLGIGLYTSCSLLRQSNVDLFIKGKKNEYAEVIIDFPCKGN